MSEPQGPCCAHLLVRYDPRRNDDGSWTSLWECAMCGHTFSPCTAADTTQQLAAARVEAESNAAKHIIKAAPDGCVCEPCISARGLLAETRLDVLREVWHRWSGDGSTAAPVYDWLKKQLAIKEYPAENESQVRGEAEEHK